ncbi:hypothetical protein HX123_05725 [Acinetobacter indicus]|nr:hypothetical protein [Acinetobacter indicus]MDM1771025.1 hypothetical protein [Acinetobacter indicus]MDM1773783.1 hypothetical protein [Acinetobacter indicus]
MVASTDIKFYVHTNNNAPQLQNAYGSMINVLDACLIDGIQIGVISSLTASGNTVTATFGAAHNLMQCQVIKITGAAQPEFNGEHRILTVPNSNEVTFELAAVPSVPIATGAISASLPPLGWEKPFSSTNEAGGGKAAYRSTNLLLPSRPFLRVVDELDPAYTATYAKYAKVGIVENMTDIDAMLGVQAPFDALNPNKNWVGTGSGTSAINGWAKWYYARSRENTTDGAYDHATALNGDRSYLIIGNSDVFYVLNGHTSADINNTLYSFGALESEDSAFFLGTTLYYGTASNSGRPAQFTSFSSSNVSTACMVRKKTGESYAMQSAKGFGLGVIESTISTGASNYVAVESALASDVFCVDSLNAYRGRLPIIKWLYNHRPYINHHVFYENDHAYKAINLFTATGAGQMLCKLW